MNQIKYILSFAMIICCLVFTQAQNDIVNKEEIITKKTFSYMENGKQVPYTLNVLQSKKRTVELAKEDKNKVNQRRILTDPYVTKVILVDNENDGSTDQFVVLRYKKSPNDSFELKQDQYGFKVIVDNHKMVYLVGEGKYDVDTTDDDYFIVEEFSMM